MSIRVLGLLAVLVVVIAAMIYLPGGTRSVRSKEQRDFDLWLGQLEPLLRSNDSGKSLPETIKLAMRKGSSDTPILSIETPKDLTNGQSANRREQVLRLLNLISEGNLLSADELGKCSKNCIEISVSQQPNSRFSTQLSADAAAEKVQVALFLKLFEAFAATNQDGSVSGG